MPQYYIYEIEYRGYYFCLFDYSSKISLIDICCFFGSLKCFKYLLLNKCEITTKTLQCSFAGGNEEIINFLKEKGHSFEKCLKISVKYHRYELTRWLIENYKCKPVSLPLCIKYYNIDAFLYFLEHEHSIDETDKYEWTSLHSAFMIGHLPIVQYLIEKGSDIEAKDKNNETPLHTVCEDIEQLEDWKTNYACPMKMSSFIFIFCFNISTFFNKNTICFQSNKTQFLLY